MVVNSVNLTLRKTEHKSKNLLKLNILNPNKKANNCKIVKSIRRKVVKFGFYFKSIQVNVQF